MRLPVVLAVALAVLALAGAAATLPAATTDAPAGPPTPTGTAEPGTPPTPTPSPNSTPTEQSDPSGENLDGKCLVGCVSGSSLLDRVPSLPAVDAGPLALLVAAALVGLAVAAYRATGDEGATAADAGRDEPARPAVGRATGSRPVPADAAATNDVFRAWRDLTGRLDVPGANARTPAELAAAAVEAGADGAAVRELRRLFVAVRYGGRPPTPDREERALAAGRRAGSGLDESGGASDESGGASDESGGASDEDDRASDESGGASDEDDRASDEDDRASDESGGASDESGGASDEDDRASDGDGGASGSDGADSSTAGSDDPGGTGG